MAYQTPTKTPRRHRALITLRILGALILFILLPSGGLAAQGPTTRVMLPFVANGSQASQQFRGNVTYMGTPRADLLVDLLRINGATEEIVQSVRTGTDGGFEFQNPPTLPGGQQYRVRYAAERNGLTEPYLGSFRCRDVTTYPTLNDLTCNFDISGLETTLPPGQALVATPHTFTWAARPAAPGETYAFYLEPGTGSAWSSGNLGRVGSYQLTNLPGGFTNNVRYKWYPVGTPSAKPLSAGRFPIGARSYGLGHIRTTSQTLLLVGPPQTRRKLSRITLAANIASCRSSPMLRAGR